MLKNNYHTHMKYCNHATGDVIDYVKKAVELKFNELGMTDHAPVLESFMPQSDYKQNACDENMKMDTMEIYLNDIKKAQAKYPDIKIYSGFEAEYLPKQLSHYKMLREKVDYLNLGVHFYEWNDIIIDSYSMIDYKSIEGYANACVEAMETGLFNTLCHPDLFMYNYKNINGERKFDEAAIAASKRIIESAIKNNVYLEVNANGFKRIRPDGLLYPYPDFWLIAREYKDLKIIIGADAHSPEALCNQNVLKAFEFVKEYNIPILDKMEINH